MIHETAFFSSTVVYHYRSDQVVELALASCCAVCGSSDWRTVWLERRQGFDLFRAFPLRVREYVLSQKVCGAMGQGEFPKDVKAPPPYGPNIPAHGVRLHECEGLP